jgi:hypothetical protein
MVRPLYFLSLLFPSLFAPCNGEQQGPAIVIANPGIAGDGPHVLYRNQEILVKYVEDSSGFRVPRVYSYKRSDRKSISLRVPTDEPGKTFSVGLKDRLENEPAEHEARKIFAVSDLEGNFRAFRRLLQGNGVIDSAFNWTYGDGHLVLTGDFFDRGDKVTEILWLIYRLEQQAEASGGYVHFVLGNHEIMNMSGDTRYVHPKYKDGAAAMNEDYMTLFGENSELGRWLRTKNVMEKIGPVLFVHGGISSAVNRAQLAARRLNNMARPYYDDSLFKYPNETVALLYGNQGPFWYRGYYQGDSPAGVAQLDSTLSHYRVRHIATGHTVISDTIAVLHGGRLINTDVPHAKGHSWGMIMEDGKFYRADAIGQRYLILE